MLSRRCEAWPIYGVALALMMIVMVFLTVPLLRFERSLAQAQAQAALEETVRLALWRMDATVTALGGSAVDRASLSQKNLSADLTRNGISSRISAHVQNQLSVQEQQERALVNPSVIWADDDWRSLEPILLERVRDLLPGASLEAVPAGSDPSLDTRRLASIPARLVVPPGAIPDASLPWVTPVRSSLLLAWIGMLAAAIAVARAIHTTVVVGEGQAAFAAAVTHEMRTPLTSFRMYAEMLASGMITSPQQRDEYLRTLSVEADRLARMVENVFAYARLEQRLSAHASESITIRKLLDDSWPYLERRAGQDGLRIVRCPGDDDPVMGQRCTIDPVVFQQVFLNLVDNACKYARTDIAVQCHRIDERIEIHVLDSGPGLGAKSETAFSAFNKSARDPSPGIGLGLYIARQLARQVGGDVVYRPSNPGADLVLILPRIA